MLIDVKFDVYTVTYRMPVLIYVYVIVYHYLHIISVRFMLHSVVRSQITALIITFIFFISMIGNSMDDELHGRGKTSPQSSSSSIILLCTFKPVLLQNLKLNLFNHVK